MQYKFPKVFKFERKTWRWVGAGGMCPGEGDNFNDIETLIPFNILTGNATIFAPFETASLILSLARTKFWALFEETASCMSAIRKAEKAQLKTLLTFTRLEEQLMQSGRTIFAICVPDASEKGKQQ